jgi:hypothetical protein
MRDAALIDAAFANRDDVWASRAFGAFVAKPASSVEKRAAEREITATSTFVAQSPPLSASMTAVCH